MLDIKLLGRFDLQVDGRQVDLTSRPAQLLFIYLVLHRRTQVRRDQLAGLIWPDSRNKNARDNLRHALWRLRKTLEEAGADLACIKADDETIRFDPAEDHRMDVAALERKIQAGADIAELIRTLELYKDDLLPGFYEDWITRERDRLRATFEARLAELLNRLQQAGEWAGVVEWGERWIALGGAPEPAYRALMIAHGRLDDLSSVAAVYQRCINSLGEQLGIGPSEGTRDLYDRIMAGEEPIAASPPSGQAVVERPVRGYELQELLGRGHFGAVYRAHQPAVGRDVAVKIILPQFADDAEFIRRFAVEAQLVARLEHPHIVPLYDYWREPGGAFLVMRWLRGGSLGQALARGPWHLEPAQQLVGQMASALHVAHREGIIHQDIKPANILLDDVGNAYLTDFGVAALVGPLKSWDTSLHGLDSNGSRGSLGYLAERGWLRGCWTASGMIKWEAGFCAWSAPVGRASPASLPLACCPRCAGERSAVQKIGSSPRCCPAGIRWMSWSSPCCGLPRANLPD
jgi:DNA-binding SARP family transcriptional activator/predicted Ser/Thr protein kinase